MTTTENKTIEELTTDLRNLSHVIEKEIIRVTEDLDIHFSDKQKKLEKLEMQKHVITKVLVAIILNHEISLY